MDNDGKEDPAAPRTDRRQGCAENAAAAEARYRTLFQAANDAIFLMQGDRFVECNPMTLKIYGCTQEQILGHPPYRFSPPRQPDGRDSKQAALEYIQAAIDQGPQFFDWVHIRYDGTPFHAEVSLNRVDLHGQVYLQAIVRDVTDARRHEEDRQRLARIESLGLVAGGIAHDFNNILAAALGYVELGLQRASHPAEVTAALDRAVSAIERARKLTQQLLAFAKGGEPVLRMVSLPRLIPESADFALRGSNVVCRCDFQEGLWPVEVDEGQIGQVLHNLVLNAQQAMPQGGEVVIRARNVEPSRDPGAVSPTLSFVRIDVNDRGGGIAPEHQAHIFEPYYTTRPNGLGLGLPTAFRIVQKHGGRLSLSVEPGVGCTFTLLLPASPGGVPSSHALPRVPTRGHGRLLVMDDESVLRDLLREVLSDAGYEVVCAADGARAVAELEQSKLEGKPFDLAILDLTVPGGMGGRQALPLLRGLEPRLRVIVSSGYSVDPILSRFQEEGFDGACAKPYRLDTLLSEIQRVLARPR